MSATTTWDPAERAAVAGADDLHVAPNRPGGPTGTPTWIWSVAVGDALYVRPHRGAESSWDRSACETGTGIITSGGRTWSVWFTQAEPGERAAVDAAYTRKYAGSPYLPPMLSAGPREATMRIKPAGAPTGDVA